MKTLRIRRGKRQGSQFEYRFYKNFVNTSLFWFSLYLESYILRTLLSGTIFLYDDRPKYVFSSEHQLRKLFGLAQWVARLIRDRWIPVSQFEPHQMPPLFH